MIVFLDCKRKVMCRNALFLPAFCLVSALGLVSCQDDDPQDNPDVEQSGDIAQGFL